MSLLCVGAEEQKRRLCYVWLIFKQHRIVMLRYLGISCLYKYMWEEPSMTLPGACGQYATLWKVAIYWIPIPLNFSSFHFREIATCSCLLSWAFSVVAVWLILCQALLEIQMILIFNRPMGFWEQLERAQLRRGQIFPKLKISVLNSSSPGNEHNHGNNLCLFRLLLHSFIKYLLKAYCVLGCILSARFYK